MAGAELPDAQNEHPPTGRADALHPAHGSHRCARAQQRSPQRAESHHKPHGRALPLMYALLGSYPYVDQDGQRNPSGLHPVDGNSYSLPPPPYVAYSPIELGYRDGAP